jgi:hypothetical protein
MAKYVAIALVAIILVSCDYFRNDTEAAPVARVNDTYLYQEDIAKLISENTTPEDSAQIVNNYITRWATQQLLIDQAKLNLSQENLDTYDKLVLEYKNDLYTEAYKNSIVARELDSTISEYEYQSFYQENKDNFKLNDELLKVRFVALPLDYNNIVQAREMLRRFNEKDQQGLNELSIQFKSYNFNDSTWVKKDALVETLPVLTGEGDQILNKSNFAQLQDSLGVYLMKVEDVLKPNDIAPLSYVRPTIEQIILNKRKLELLRKLEKDITRDAIENKNFEIYNEK